MIKLYYAPGTIAAASAIALREAGLEHALEAVDFASGAQTKSPYLSINPKGRVPALVTQRGALTETPAILDWIAASAPEAELMPHDSWHAARVRELMSYLASTMHVNHAHKRRGARWADDETAHDAMRAKVPETMAACCDFLEKTLPLSSYAVGSSFTVADPMLYTVCQWLPGDEVDLANYPRLAAYLSLMDGRESVQAVRAEGILV